MGRELEVKYAASEDALARIAQDAAVLRLAVSEETIPMETTYFDTPLGALSAKKWMLRVRREGTRGVVTMKTAGDGRVRGEWEYEGDTVNDAAKRLCALGAPEELREILRAQPIPVCGAKFTRRALRLRFPDGSEAELALDSGVLFRAERQSPLCEMELELKRGAETAMLELAEQLAKAYDLLPERQSKFVRAAAL